MEASLGNTNFITRAVKGQLAFVFAQYGEMQKAEQVWKELLEATMEEMGEESDASLANMGNLAYTYGDQGRWKETEELEVKVMETKKRVLGEEHPEYLDQHGQPRSDI